MKIGNLIKFINEDKIGIVVSVIEINTSSYIKIKSCEILLENGDLEDCIWNSEIEVLSEL